MGKVYGYICSECGRAADEHWVSGSQVERKCLVHPVAILYRLEDQIINGKDVIGVNYDSPIPAGVMHR
jgi:hypothetical protein